VSSEVEICNMALGYVGVTHEISSLAEDSTEAEQCDRFYEATRDQVLRDFPWPFAVYYRALDLVEEEPNDDWDYSYRYPTDCMRGLRVVDGNRIQTTRLPWEVAHDDSGKLIFTDQDEAVLRFIRRVTDPEVYDPSFVETLAWRLGSKLAIPLARSTKERDYAFERYRLELSTARVNAINEGEVDADPDPEVIRARA